MKYLIVGLGNPGAEYHYNRHNIGFLILNQFAQSKDLEFSQSRHGYTVEVSHKGKKLVLLKPTTFMNLSGKAVRHHLTANKIEPKNLLVLVDDIALPFAKLRLRAKGSAGGHNGLKDISRVLGNDQYARLRFGVGDDFRRGRQAEYVLEDFPKGELIELPTLMDKSIQIIQDFTTIGIDRAMTTHNKG